MVFVSSMVDEDTGANSEDSPPLTVEAIKQAGNEAFRKARLLNRTTAGKQYLHEAQAAYVQAIQKLSHEKADGRAMELACTLHTNLAATYLMEKPARYDMAKAAADVALTVHDRHVKALYRRAQALLEDNREGVPESNLRAAQADLEAAMEVEPHNREVERELVRVRNRIASIEAARKVPTAREVIQAISPALTDRGMDCLDDYGYVWGQSETLVHIFVPLRALAAKRSDLTCEIRAKSLHIKLPVLHGEPAFELCGALHKQVRPDECTWQLEEGGFLLHVELWKREDDPSGEHWLRAFEGHPDTLAPSAKEQEDLRSLTATAQRARLEGHLEEREKPAHADDVVKRLRDLCPGVNVEWGDTSLGQFR